MTANLRVLTREKREVPVKRLLMSADTLTALKKMTSTLLCCTVLMVLAAPAQTPPQTIKADPGTNNPPPAGAILDLSGTPIPGGGNAIYQHYTVNFIATVANTACTEGCTTAITFAFRDDPAQISFANASVVDLTTGSVNLLHNGDFSGGVYTDNGNPSTPISWTYANVFGAQAGGGVIGPGAYPSVSAYCYTIGGVAVNYCWFDGAVQAYDAISQTINTNVGDTYQISFDVAEDSAIVAFAGNECCSYPPNFPGSDCWAAAHGSTDPFPCDFSDFSINGDTTNPGGNGINVTVYAQGGVPAADSETQTLKPGVQSIYTFAGDKYKITPSPYSNGGESLTITAVPILKSNFASPSNFLNETCVPFADYSAANGADTCVNFQADCSVGGVPGAGDCNTLLYTLLESYELPPDLSAIGGPDFLVVHGKGCPTTGSDLAQSIFTDYYVTTQDPTTKGGGNGTGSCFEVMYTPGAPPITGAGSSTSRFVGWESPVVDGQLNMVKAGSTRPLIFNWNDNLGNPIVNLSYCNTFVANATNSGNVCQDAPTVNPPWVNLSSFGVGCPSSASVNETTDTSLSGVGGSGFQNNGGGNYQLNWKSQKSWKGYCANVEATFDNGLVVVPASMGFQFN